MRDRAGEDPSREGPPRPRLNEKVPREVRGPIRSLHHVTKGRHSTRKELPTQLRLTSHPENTTGTRRHRATGRQERAQLTNREGSETE